ncbi:hypothetical protein KSS87_009632 [Heliosperma pusillum]|nr:hypothetical protein KSS87_009632 [Heliosperma pusillum]
MEDEEDVAMVSPSLEQQQSLQPEHQNELQLNDAVSSAVDSPDIPPLTTVHGQERENKVENVERSNVEGVGDVNVRCEVPPLPEVKVSDELEVHDVVSTAGDSSKIPQLVTARDEREGEVESVEESKLERDEGVIGVDVAPPLPEVKVSDELAVSEVVEREESKIKSNCDEDVAPPLPEVKVSDELAAGEVTERGIGGEDNEELKAKSEESVAVDEAELSSIGVDVEEPKQESKEEVVVEEAEVTFESSDNLLTEGVDRETEVKRVNEPIEESDEQVAKMSGEFVTVNDEMDVRNEDENVEKVEAMEEKQVKGEEMELVTEEKEVKNEDVVEKDGELDGKGGEGEGEASLIGKNVEGDEVMKDGDMDEKVEEIVGGEKEAVLCANEVEGDVNLKTEDVAPLNEEVQMADELVEKTEEMGEEEKEAVLCANEVEGDVNLEVKDAPPLNKEVEMVDELVENKAENDEKEKEVEEKEEDEGTKVEEEVPQEGSKEEGIDEDMDHSPTIAKKDDLMVEEGTPIAENEMELEEEGMKSGSGSGGKRKRNAKPGVKTPSRKIVGEDVCFICLDGGDLVLCDRRGCPKAYHPSCVDHDDEFFKTKGHWYCGSLVQLLNHVFLRLAALLFDTLVKGTEYLMLNVDAVLVELQLSIVGICATSVERMPILSVVPVSSLCAEPAVRMQRFSVLEETKDSGQDAFSDKSSWEYLFKDYWLEQKEKLCISSDELSNAKNPSKASDKHQPSVEGNNDAGSDSDSLDENSELNASKRKKSKKNSKSVDNDSDNSSEKNTGSGKRKSKRRLRSHHKDVSNSDSEHSSPDTSRRRGGKARKLSKSRSKGAQSKVEWASKELLEFITHMKNGDQSVLTQFDVQGLLLEYIKINKLRDPRRQSQIICDSMLQKLFHKPRVGHFEMLKLLESHFFLKDADDNQGTVANSEMRQLDADDNLDSPHDGSKSRGKKSRKREGRGSQSNLDDYAAIDMHNINLIFLRRNLMDALLENPETFHDKAVGAFVRIRISGSSKNQDIYRLVQITGTSKAAEPYKVGKRTTDIMLEILNLDKTETVSIDTMSNQDFSEDECKRLRQSIKCGLINRMTVGDIIDKARELQEVRVLDWLEAEIVRLSHLRDRASEKGRYSYDFWHFSPSIGPLRVNLDWRECVEKLQLLKTPEERQRKLDEIPEVHADPKMDPSYESEEEIDTTRQESDTRRREPGFSRRGRDEFSSRKGGSTIDSWSANARPPNQKWEPNRNLSGKGISGRKEDSVFTSPTRERPWSNGLDKGSPRLNSREKGLTSESTPRVEHSAVRSDMSAIAADVSQSPRISSVAGQTDLKGNETEKMWHYRDPARKVQGPFSMTQLRKWSNTGYFPNDLKVWRIPQGENDSILLTDILSGILDKAVPSVNNAPSSIDTSKLSGNARSSGPIRSSFQSSSQQTRGGIERLPSPTPTSPSTPIARSNLSRKSKWDVGSNNEHFAPSGPKPDLSSSSSITNNQRVASQSTVQLGGQPLTVPNSMMNQPNWSHGVSNVSQPVIGQNPSVYNQGWSSNNPNIVPTQVAYGQWSTVSGSNQVPSYGPGYTGPGNIAPNMSGMTVPWNGQQQQIVNPNTAWAGQPTVAAAPMGQQAGFMPGGIPTMGWSGAVPNPSAGNTNPGWGAPPGNAGVWGGGQNRNSGGTR